MNVYKTKIACFLTAAALITGSLGAGAPQAFADDDDYVPVFVQVDPATVLNGKLNSIIAETSSYADIESSLIEDALKNGKTLLQASGLSEKALFNALVSPLYQDIDRAYNSLNITSKQKEELYTKAKEDVTKAINTPGYNPAAASFDGEALINDSLKSMVIVASSYADIEYTEVVNALRAGKSLSNAVNLKPSVLTDLLLKPIQKEIDQAFKNNLISAEQQAALKEQAKTKVEQAINSSNVLK
ncbi:hypothetical protein [Paenibacillus sp. y28]|uniref:hypothetical protein n=1 Tax=Paenibacillus sp. y28 TaxID=3129110 RepID=UPI003019D33F